MCGIAGEIDFKDSVELADYHEKMLLSMKRRGPDGHGIYRAQNAVLLHTRLAVIDVENGKQPMTATRGNQSFTICYNGELYNTAQLRVELIAAGMSFKTNSDTEVVLKAYMHYGESCVQHFNGIFAFAIYESHNRRLFIARDKMGVKPFFYTLQGGRFIFASELKTVLLHPAVPHEIDEIGIGELLLIGPGRTPGCGVFKNVFELKPGECGVFNESGLHLRQYFEFVDRENTQPEQEVIERVRALVQDAIERQLVSDVPIGTFLSGGLDSSLISSIAAQYMRQRGKQLTTFSVTYKNNEKYFKKSKFQPNSDDSYIKIMADYLQSNHISVTVDTDEVVEALYRAVDARDLPGMADVDSSLLLFCKEIKNHVTVALSGECADEIFGGYPWFRDPQVRERYGFPWAQSTAYRAEFIHPQWQSRLNAQEFVNSRYEQTLQNTPCRQGLSPLENRMRQMVYLNAKWFMQTLLDRKDRMSMYSGLEVRVPFCDYRIAEYLYSVPWQLKDYNGREKGLLRQAMQGWLPSEVLWRKKSPYPKTHNPAYFEAVKAELRQLLANPAAPIFALVDKAALEKLLHAERAEPWYGQLMTTPQTVAYMLMLNYWLEKFKVKIV